MKKVIIFIGVIALIVIAGFIVARRESVNKDILGRFTLIDEEVSMKITSSAFESNTRIPAKYTCDGANINPPLEISDVPESAKSLVLISDDPDAPVGTWVHWTVWNIGTSTAEIAENSVPASAVEGKTSFGKPGYGGPCPPSGTHRYFFKLYALDTVLDLASDEEAPDIEKVMYGHIIESAELVGLYEKK